MLAEVGDSLEISASAHYLSTELHKTKTHTAGLKLLKYNEIYILKAVLTLHSLHFKIFASTAWGFVF